MTRGVIQRNISHFIVTREVIQRNLSHFIMTRKLIKTACGSYQDFLDGGLLLARKQLNQGFLLVKLKSSLQKFYGRHHDLVDRYGISVSQMTTDMFHLS